ncbi:MAG: hypothetical protein JOZ08_02190 [Verrucomicrobia bacterium]|nr:hypothetical protein [Verrucomicrobiota bacterium]MBV8274469.1 hypothetical protein [Verrucomicrobiota bacterium]
MATDLLAVSNLDALTRGNEKDVIEGAPIADALVWTLIEADIICVNLRPSAVRLFSVSLADVANGGDGATCPP